MNVPPHDKVVDAAGSSEVLLFPQDRTLHGDMHPMFDASGPLMGSLPETEKRVHARNMINVVGVTRPLRIRSSKAHYIAKSLLRPARDGVIDLLNILEVGFTIIVWLVCVNVQRTAKADIESNKRSYVRGACPQIDGIGANSDCPITAEFHRDIKVKTGPIRYGWVLVIKVIDYR